MNSIMKVRNKWRCQIRRKGYPNLSKMFVLRADASAWGTWAEEELLKGRTATDRVRQHSGT